jgi:hypothetical protein
VGPTLHGLRGRGLTRGTLDGVTGVQSTNGGEEEERNATGRNRRWEQDEGREHWASRPKGGRSGGGHGRGAFNGVAWLLQTNLDRCRRAQDLMSQNLAEWGVGLAVAAETYPMRLEAPGTWRTRPPCSGPGMRGVPPTP